MDGVAQGSREHFRALLEQAVEQPERRAEIIREIEGVFNQEKAVLVADLDSFTATTAEHGILTFLVLLVQVHRLTRPILERHGGLLLKSEADTLFCLFDQVDDAIRAGCEIRACLRSTGLQTANGSPVTIAMGIGYGTMLNLGNEDALGAEVNFAYKLGEDVGRGGDILLTWAAHAQARDPEHRFEERAATVSGMRLPYFALL
jgi:class 3 adenylate cyclase